MAKFFLAALFCLPVAACQNVAGTAGEVPVAAIHDGKNAWVLAYSAEPQEAAATRVEWRLYRLAAGQKQLAWAVAGVQPEFGPESIAAHLVTQPTGLPVAWVAANYAGGQYRIHRLDAGQERFWRVPGAGRAADGASLHVATTPEGSTWIAYEQPRYRNYPYTNRELFELTGAPQARVLREHVLWTACAGAACRVLSENGDAFVLEENGVEVLRYPIRTRYNAPLRAVCRDSAGEPLLIAEEWAYSLSGKPLRGGEATAALPEALRKRFTLEYGRLICDQPGDWLWISDTETKSFRIDYASGEVTPLESAPIDRPSAFAYRENRRWVQLGLRFEETVTKSCDSPREIVRTCIGEYDRFSLAAFPLTTTTTAP